MKDDILDGYVRVSEVLSQEQDFSHIDEAVLTNKANIGTRLHKAIETFFEDKMPIPDPQVTPYFNSFLKWHGLMKPKVIMQESRYYDHDKKFTGRIDAVIKLPYEKIPVLVDWKTSALVNPLIWPKQGHAYHHLLIKNGVTYLADRVLFIKLDPRGNLPKVFTVDIDPQGTQEFLELVDNYWEKRNNLDMKCQ